MASAAPLSVERNRLRDFTRAAADWAWEVDADLRIVALSENAGAIANQPYMFMIGQPLGSLGRLLNGPGGEPPIDRARREATAFRGQLLDAGGQGLYRLTGSPLLGDDGELRGFRGLASLSDRRAASNERLVAAMGGELRAPLDAIIGSAEAMARETHGPLPPHYADYARDIAAAGRHLLALLGDLLERQSGDEAIAAERFELREVAEQAMALVALRAAAKGIAVGLSEPGRSLPARADRRRVLQILVNLLTNAVKFTPEGGRIDIELVRVGVDRVGARIRDTGPGIAVADQERVFAKFARLPGAEEGSGLGLHISRELARRMNGDLLLESAPGEGACFTLVLPAG
jgi:signal transduction histidine kinase